MTAPKKIAVGLFSLAILGGGYLAWFPFHTLNTSVARGGQPVVDCPAEVDLGVQTLGSMTAGELVISNQGGEVLVLDNLQTSCSCMGFDVEVGGEFRSFGRMELAPAEKVRARVRVTVQESVGNGVNVFQFGTNDPLRPTVRVRVRAQVIGAKLCSPESFLLGMCGLANLPKKLSKFATSLRHRTELSLPRLAILSGSAFVF